MTTLPKSAVWPLSGLIGILAGAAAVMLLRDWQQPMHLKTLAVLGIVSAAMLAGEAAMLLKARDADTILGSAPRRPLKPGRVASKLLGFWSTIAAVAAVYWLIPEYSSEFYLPFKQAGLVVLPWVAVLSPFYVAYVDRRTDDPDDAYLRLGQFILGRRPWAWNELRVHTLGWGVKTFFLPLMFTFLSHDLQVAWSRPPVPVFATYGDFYEFFYSSVIFFDVMIAALGYIWTLRILNSQIRSVDATVIGWVACIMCYPPFWPAISDIYFGYERDGLYWGRAFFDMPVVYVLWGSAIIALHALYIWSTASFGFRFSNLTHRGIITSGPFRWMKHPSYTAKCASYWLISVPFIPATDPLQALQACLLLAGVSGIYVVRAITEERHLGRDPVYRDYAAYITEHGAWARLRGLLGRRGVILNKE